MSICKLGLKSNCQGKKITISVPNNHPLVMLANAIPWNDYYELIKDDLKKTAKGCWHLGRKLQIRVHLGVFLLRCITDLSYRKLEEQIKSNAAYQLFCGYGLVSNWRCPDHTKMESFISRLSPENQRMIANDISQLAVKFGYANPAVLDIDSTIQEANIRYPSDMQLLSRLTEKAKKIVDALKNKGIAVSKKASFIDIKSVKAKVKTYLFNKKKWSTEEKSTFQLGILKEVATIVEPLIFLCRELQEQQLASLSWHVNKAIQQVADLGEQCLSQVKTFVETGVGVKDKILSLHLKEVACFVKRHKKTPLFGRRIQLGRLEGNFLIVPCCKEVKQDDKHSIEPMIKLHRNLFKDRKLKSLSADSGYYSKKNEKYVASQGVGEVGIQKTSRVKSYAVEMAEDVRKRLYDRRAGIEPIIGHCKLGGQLGRHREKKDETALAAAYQSVLGFNLRQMVNRLTNDNDNLEVGIA